uniref:Uncharacterized protein n=1 Tax=Nocardia terpenica TaxID=455432 RepID=A0A809R4L7_9NOCA|nr:hypothetical protein [Nocardia terpenica]
MSPASRSVPISATSCVRAFGIESAVTFNLTGSCGEKGVQPLTSRIRQSIAEDNRSPAAWPGRFFRFEHNSFNFASRTLVTLRDSPQRLQCLDLNVRQLDQHPPERFEEDPHTFLVRHGARSDHQRCAPTGCPRLRAC